MLFEEKEYIEIKNINDVFIYFLIKNNEVVYVGQTQSGLIRPLQHKYNKIFDSVYIINCGKDELDILEDKYIIKYKPIYNKNLNIKINSSLQKIKKNIKSIYPSFNLNILKKIIKKLDIPTINFNNIISIENKYETKILRYYEEVFINGKRN